MRSIHELASFTFFSPVRIQLAEYLIMEDFLWVNTTQSSAQFSRSSGRKAGEIHRFIQKRIATRAKIQKEKGRYDLGAPENIGSGGQWNQLLLELPAEIKSSKPGLYCQVTTGLPYSQAASGLRLWEGNGPLADIEHETQTSDSREVSPVTINHVRSTWSLFVPRARSKRLQLQAVPQRAERRIGPYVFSRLKCFLGPL